MGFSTKTSGNPRFLYYTFNIRVIHQREGTMMLKKMMIAICLTAVYTTHCAHAAVDFKNKAMNMNSL